MYYFFGFSAIRVEFILDYWNTPDWNKSDDFWDSPFDRPDRLSRLRAFPYDRFKMYIHERPDRLDRTQLCPSDRGRLSRPGRL